RPVLCPPPPPQHAAHRAHRHGARPRRRRCRHLDRVRPGGPQALRGHDLRGGGLTGPPQRDERVSKPEGRKSKSGATKSKLRGRESKSRGRESKRLSFRRSRLFNRFSLKSKAWPWRLFSSRRRRSPALRSPGTRGWRPPRRWGETIAEF